MKLDGGNGKQTGQNDAEVFHKLFVEEYPNLLRYAGILLRARHSDLPVQGRAEVAVQETFASAWKYRRKMLESASPVGWLYNALRYKVKDIFKEEYRWTRLLLRFESSYIQPEESHISLETEFDGIVTKEELDLLRQIYQQGRSYKEICQETGLSKPALASKVHRLKEKIRNAMKE